MKTLGDVIKEYRLSREDTISIRTFASMSGLSPSYISMLEKGYDQRGNEIHPSINTIAIVADAIGISFDELFNQLDCKVIVNESVTNTSTLSPDESAIIKMYRQLKKSRQKDIYDYTKMIYDKELKNASKEELAQKKPNI